MSSGIIAENYRQAIRLRRGRWAHASTAVVIAMIVIWPLVMPDRWLSAGIFALIAAIAALGLHVTTGLAGQVSLGHSAFVGIGAYTAIWLGADRGYPWWIWLPGAAVVSAVVGGMIGPFALRLRGLYLAVVTVALLAITQYLWAIWGGLTGGFNGRGAQEFSVFGHSLFDDLEVAGLTLSFDQQFWFVAALLLAAGAGAARNLARTRPGRAWASVRDRDMAAAVAGVPIARAKLSAFVIGAGYGGVAGALLGAYQSYVVPEQFNLDLAVKYVAIIVIGGLGSVSGAIIGALFVTLLPLAVELVAGSLPFLETKPSTSGGFTVDLVSMFMYGLAIVVVLVVEPRGLIGLWERCKLAVRTWPWSP